MAQFKTWLPLFDGFYNTWYDPSDFFDDRVNDFYEETEIDLIIDNNLFEFDDFKTDVINKHVEIVERELKDLGLVESITFERLDSPKFYNYRNDSVDVEIEMLPKNIRSEEHTSELQSRGHLVCRLLLEEKNDVDDRAEETRED